MIDFVFFLKRDESSDDALFRSSLTRMDSEESISNVFDLDFEPLGVKFPDVVEDAFERRKLAVVRGFFAF